MKTNWRKTLFNLHLYAGLFLGLFMLTAATTGVILAFRPEFDPAWNPQLWHLPHAERRLTLDEIIATAHSDYAAGKIDFVNIDAAPDAAVLVRFRDREELYLSPFDGSLLEERNKETSFFYMMEKLHRYLFLGKQGQWITGTASLALGLMVVTGVYLWWPKKSKPLKASFTLDPKLQHRAWNVNLHKVVGIYSAVLLSLAVFTGAGEYLNWVAKTYVPGFAGREARTTLHSSAAVAGTKPASYESELQTVAAAVGPAQYYRFGLPKTSDGPIEVEYVAAGAPHDNALAYVYLDRVTGKVLLLAPYESVAIASRFYLWLLPIHLGMIGGYFGRVLVILGALGCIGLIVTGFWLYYRRKLNPIRRPLA